MRRYLPLNGTFNIRDLGGYPLESGGETLWRRCLRADSPQQIGVDAVDKIIREGVSTVVDLRSARQVAAKASPFRTIEHVCYHHISLFEEPSNIIHLAQPLSRLYSWILGEHGNSIAAVMEAVADARDGTVMIHCDSGKDRTGLIVALLLAHAGVDANTVAEDYALTAPLIEPVRNELIANLEYFGIGVSSFGQILDCNRQTMLETLKHVTECHGSVSHYLATIGVSPETCQLLRRRLV